jgi:hypothetical protein
VHDVSTASELASVQPCFRSTVREEEEEEEEEEAGFNVIGAF